MLAVAIWPALLLNGCNPSLRAYQIVSDDMAPLLHAGDRIFVDESADARSNLHDGEVIVFRRDGTVLVKRILAMPNETISGENRKIFRNGKLLDEPYLAPSTGEDIPALTTFPARKVAPGELFVMGDNRDISLDSRSDEYAPVELSDVVGQYTMTYWHSRSAGK